MLFSAFLIPDLDLKVDVGVGCRIWTLTPAGCANRPFCTPKGVGSSFQQPSISWQTFVSRPVKICSAFGGGMEGVQFCPLSYETPRDLKLYPRTLRAAVLAGVQKEGENYPRAPEQEVVGLPVEKGSVCER